MKLNVLHEVELADLGGEAPVERPPDVAPEPDLGPSPEAPRPGYQASGYTIDNAKSQIDGILKRWMDLAGAFPEGDQRHNFLQIGERLEEIANTLERDFIRHEAEAPL